MCSDLSDHYIGNGGSHFVNINMNSNANINSKCPAMGKATLRSVSVSTSSVIERVTTHDDEGKNENNDNNDSNDSNGANGQGKKRDIIGVAKHDDDDVQDK